MSKRLVMFTVGLACIGAACGPLHAQARRCLFLDAAFIQQSENVSLRVSPPQQREIVIRPDRPWEQLMISLLLNVDTGALGQLRAGLLDAAGNAINSFGPDDCKVLRTNSTRAAVGWAGGSDLDALKGREVRLTFVGSRAKLYSFRFE